MFFHLFVRIFDFFQHQKLLYSVVKNCFELILVKFLLSTFVNIEIAEEFFF